MEDLSNLESQEAVDKPLGEIACTGQIMIEEALTSEQRLANITDLTNRIAAGEAIDPSTISPRVYGQEGVYLAHWSANGGRRSRL